MGDAKKPCDAGDELRVLATAADGPACLVERHTADHRHEIGVIQPLRDGMPIPPGGTVITMEAKDAARGIYSVREATGKAHSGATSNAFRSGWETTFGGKRAVVGQA